MEGPASSPSRKLTTHQQSVLIQVLLAFPEQQVGIEHCSAGDASSYARDFLTIFNAVRWNVAELGAAKVSAVTTGGLAILVSRNQNLPPSAEALRDALRIYGIEVETISDAAREIAAGEFVFSVGPLPQ
jgi:hypothetical protein